MLHSKFKRKAKIDSKSRDRPRGPVLVSALEMVNGILKKVRGRSRERYRLRTPCQIKIACSHR